jgi:glycosyltransferase involved in cell wall biosynthesis
MDSGINHSILISIIVPVYNASAYIDQCIESITNQTLDEIEIILINDGSTDNSLQHLENWSIKDRRIKVYNQRNQGVSEARNFGLNLAKGQYIGFVDADDWVEPEMYEKMYNEIINQKADWVISNVFIHKSNHNPILRLELTDRIVELTSDKTFSIIELFRFKYDFANWNKLFKKEIIDEHTIRFNTEMKLWEDLLFNLKYILFLDKIVIINEGFYHYRVVENSLTRSNSSLLVNQYNKLFGDYINYLSSHNNQKELFCFKNEISRAAYYYLINEVYVNTLSQSDSFFKNIIHFRNTIKHLNKDMFNIETKSFDTFKKIKYWLFLHEKHWLLSLLICTSNLFRKR